MPSIYLKNEELRKKYSTKYFDLLKHFYSYKDYISLVKLEREESRDNLHTYEYWWIKYRMLKRFVRVNGLEPIPEQLFQLERKTNKTFEMLTNSVLTSFMENRPSLDPRILRQLESFIYSKICSNWKIVGERVIDSNGDNFLKNVFLQNYESKLNELIEIQINFWNSEWHINNDVIVAISKYFINYEITYFPKNETEKEILENIVDKYQVKEKARNFFNEFYKGKTIVLEFDDVFEKYGIALFDFYPYDVTKTIEYDIICQYDNKYVNAAASVTLSYFIAKLFEKIREYESIFNCEIIINSSEYWQFIKRRTEAFLFANDVKAFEDEWWLNLNSSALTSKVSYVPCTIFENFKNEIINLK